jgi:hypothetical protein
MRIVRNVAIVAAIAALVDFAPGGGNATTAVLTVLLLGFLATLAVAGQQLYRENRLTVDSLSDRDRGIVYGAVGLVVLMVAGASKMLATGGGTLIWIGLLVLAVVAIARIWASANSY